eukprot:14543373-Alexandrium_andersonii.AAC.1
MTLLELRCFLSTLLRPALRISGSRSPGTFGAPGISEHLVRAGPGGGGWTTTRGTQPRRMRGVDMSQR